MKVDYRRDLNSNSLVLAAEQQPDIASYQVRMLMANELEGFLPCRVHQMDGSLLFYYDITSTEGLSEKSWRCCWKAWWRRWKH